MMELIEGQERDAILHEAEHAGREAHESMGVSTYDLSFCGALRHILETDPTIVINVGLDGGHFALAMVRLVQDDQRAIEARGFPEVVLPDEEDDIIEVGDDYEDPRAGTLAGFVAGLDILSRHLPEGLDTLKPFGADYAVIYFDVTVATLPPASEDGVVLRGLGFDFDPGFGWYYPT